MDIVRRRRSLRFLSGNANEILASLPNRDRAIVTEPLRPTSITSALATCSKFPWRPLRSLLTVAGIYYDYSSDRGLLLVDRSTLLKYLPDQRSPTSRSTFTRAPNIVKCGGISNPRVCGIFR